MKMKRLIALLLAILCALPALPAAAAETREGVIHLEGMEETIEETRFESPEGFSFWYAQDVLQVDLGTVDGTEGVIVSNPYADDYLILSGITEEQAAEYTKPSGDDFLQQSAAGRVREDVYLTLENGYFRFLTVIAENGHYLRASGAYSQEAADGISKYFDLVLSSVAFSPVCLLEAAWGEQAADDSGRADVILTALRPVTDVTLLTLSWDGEGSAPAWEEGEDLGALDRQQSVCAALSFAGDLPNNGIRYTDEAGVFHRFALDISGEDGALYFWNLEE